MQAGNQYLLDRKNHHDSSANDIQIYDGFLSNHYSPVDCQGYMKLSKNKNKMNNKYRRKVIMFKCTQEKKKKFMMRTWCSSRSCSQPLSLNFDLFEWIVSIDFYYFHVNLILQIVLWCSSYFILICFLMLHIKYCEFPSLFI